MEKELRLRVHFNGRWTSIEGYHLGFENENNATVLAIELPKETYGATHFIEFIKPSGVTLSSAPLAEVTEEDGVHAIKLTLTNSVIDENGRYFIQYVGRKYGQNSVAFKSELKALDIERSINAGIEIREADPDFITWATSEIAALHLLADQVPGIEGRLQAVERLLEDASIMGVIFYGSETIGERVGLANGKRAGINGEPNDFDYLPIYKDIHTYENENGEKIWACEKPFYYKHVVNGIPDDDDFYEGFFISPTKHDDTWGLHTAFWDKNKENRGRFTLGAYKASFNEDGTKLVTKSGRVHAAGISLEQARQLAAANGAHVQELRKANAVNVLMMIEFANRDLQRSFTKGITFASSIYGGDVESIQEETACNVVRITTAEMLQWWLPIAGNRDNLLKMLRPGDYITIYDDNFSDVMGESYRTVTKVEIKMVFDRDKGEEVEVVEIGYTGTPVLWKNEDLYPIIPGFNCKTGTTDSLPGSSNVNMGELDGLRHFSYRGLEDWWGVCYEWTDGETLRYKREADMESETYYGICFDPDYYHELNFADSGVEMPHYEQVVKVTSIGYPGIPKSFEQLSQYPGVLVPKYSFSDGLGTNATYYADDMHIYNMQTAQLIPAWRPYAFFRGGSVDNGWRAGPFFVNVVNSSYWYWYFGVRLSYDHS